MNPLERVASWVDGESGEPQPRTTGTFSGSFDLASFISRHGLVFTKEDAWQGGEKFVLETCPFNPEHSGGCAVITRGPDGALGFKCHHNSCVDNGWKELRARLDPSYRAQPYEVGRRRESYSRDEGWPPIVPFSAELQRIPDNLMPGPVGDMARAVAAATETPVEMAVMCGLGVIAASIAGKFKVWPFPGYSEPLQIFTATGLASGNRKSAVITEMVAPFVEEEQRLMAEILPERKRLDSERKTAVAHIERLRKQAVSKGDASLTKEIARLESELPELPFVPRLWAQDVTPERLGAMMAENNGRMAVISDEGGIFDILAGRYSKTGAPNLDLFLQGHTGSAVRVDRGSREPVIINDPALTLVLTPQPDVLRSLGKERTFRGRGLLARFFYMLPPSPLGHRTHNTVPVSSSTKSDYNRCISSLRKIPNLPDGLSFSPGALSKWKEFQHSVEGMMAEYGPLQNIQDWASKLPGGLARIAAGIHCSVNANGLVPNKIELETLRIALDLGEYLISHALATFSLIQKPEANEHAEKLLVWILRDGKSEFTLREMHRAHQSIFERRADMTGPVDLLEERGYIRPAVRESKQGRPSELYEVNPAVLAPGEG